MSRSRPYRLFAAAILVTGVLSGLVGGSITVLVRTVQHLTYGYTEGPLLLGVIAASPERRLLGPAVGCAVAGLGWWLLRRKATVPVLNHAIREDQPFAPVPMSIDAALQVVAVGSGASLGREQAPRMLAAVGTELLIRAGSIPPAQRRVLLGGAAGAGLAAVYNVPAAGALFTLGIVLHSWRPTAILVAIATSSIATVTAWPVSHGAPTFLWPPTDVTPKSVLIAVAVMPVAALVGTGFNRLVIQLAAPRAADILDADSGHWSRWLGHWRDIHLASPAARERQKHCAGKPCRGRPIGRGRGRGGAEACAHRTVHPGGRGGWDDHSGFIDRDSHWRLHRDCRQPVRWARQHPDNGIDWRCRGTRSNPTCAAFRRGVHRRTDPSTPRRLRVADPGSPRRAHHTWGHPPNYRKLDSPGTLPVALPRPPGSRGSGDRSSGSADPARC